MEKLHKLTKNLTGSTYNKLTVLKFVKYRIKPNGKRESRWLCLCKCGVEKEVSGSNLTTGAVTSCGCSRKIRRKQNNVRKSGGIIIQCKIHGMVKRDRKPQKGTYSDCPLCNSRHAKLKPFKHFVTEAEKVQPAHFMYNENSYNNSNTIVVLCKKHGEFKQLKDKILLGQVGCDKCRRPVHNKLTFIQAAKNIHGNKYSYTTIEDIRITKATVVSIICRIHGSFKQQVGTHLKGSGCQKCSKTGFVYEYPGYLYILKIITDSEIVYKVGITNHSVEERFTPKELLNVSVLHYEYFNVGKNAYIKEQEILKRMKQYKYFGVPLFKKGNTELLTKNPLAELKDYIHENNTKKESMAIFTNATTQ